MTKLKHSIYNYLKKIKGQLGTSFYHDPIMLSILTLFSLMLVGLLLMLIFRVEPTAVDLPLTYNVLFGITYSSQWYGMYSYLGALVVLGAINFLIAWAYFDKERLISYLISFVTILLSVLTILYVYNLTALIR